MPVRAFQLLVQLCQHSQALFQKVICWVITWVDSRHMLMLLHYMNTNKQDISHPPITIEAGGCQVVTHTGSWKLDDKESLRMSHCVVGLRACFKMCNRIYTSMINQVVSGIFINDIYRCDRSCWQAHCYHSYGKNCQLRQYDAVIMECLIFNVALSSPLNTMLLLLVNMDISSNGGTTYDKTRNSIMDLPESI